MNKCEVSPDTSSRPIEEQKQHEGGVSTKPKRPQRSATSQSLNEEQGIYTYTFLFVYYY